MLNRLVTALRVAVIIILLIVVLLPILLGLMILLWIVDVPRKVGQRLDFEGGIRAMLYRVVDLEKTRQFRNDMLHILESEVEVEGDPDRWGLLREIDKSQKEIERRLKNGEFAFSFVGGVAAFFVGNLLGIVFGGLLLTIVGLLFSLLVTARIIPPTLFATGVPTTGTTRYADSSFSKAGTGDQSSVLEPSGSLSCQ